MTLSTDSIIIRTISRKREQYTNTQSKPDFFLAWPNSYLRYRLLSTTITHIVVVWLFSGWLRWAVFLFLFIYLFMVIIVMLVRTEETSRTHMQHLKFSPNLSQTGNPQVDEISMREQHAGISQTGLTCMSKGERFLYPGHQEKHTHTSQ